MVNLLNFLNQEYEHHMRSIYLAFGNENMDAIGSQFTWLLQGATFTSTAMPNCMIIVHVMKAPRHLNGLSWMIMLTLPAPKAQAN